MKRIKLVFFLLLLLFLFTGISCERKRNLGVWKSVDGGENWEQKVRISKRRTISSLEVLTLKIDPEDSNTVYIGTRGRGIYKTTDGAETWKQTDLKIGKVPTIAINSKDSEVLYAAVYVGELGKIYKSTNKGENFEEIYSETHSGTPILSLAIDSYDPRKIYAGTGAGALLKSEDSGRSWVVKKWFRGGISQIAVNPKDTRRILVGTFKGLFKSIDGGETWKDLSESLEEYEKSISVHSLVFNNADPDILYLGSRYGLLKSTDEGENWEEIPLLVKPGETSLLRIATDYQDPKKIYLGLDSTVYRSTNGGKKWIVKKISSNLIQTITCDPENSSVIYVGIKKKKG